MARHPAALHLPCFTSQGIPATQLVPQRFHKLEGFQILIVQVGLAKEQQHDVVAHAGFLFLGHLDVSITVGNKVNFYSALVGLLELLRPLPQILV